MKILLSNGAEHFHNWNYELENEDVLLDSSYSNSLPWSTFKSFFGRVSCIDHSQHTHPHMKTVWGTNIPMPWVCTLIHNVRLFIFLTYLGLEREPWISTLASPLLSNHFSRCKVSFWHSRKTSGSEKPMFTGPEQCGWDSDLSLYSISF